MRESPNGMASASQADSGEFDSRHLLHEKSPFWGFFAWKTAFLAYFHKYIDKKYTRREIYVPWQAEMRIFIKLRIIGAFFNCLIEYASEVKARWGLFSVRS